MRQRMQETLYETADAGDTLSDRRCRRHYIRQEMQETLYGKAYTGLFFFFVVVFLKLTKF